MNLLTAFAQRVERYGSKPLLIDGDATYTYQDVWQLAAGAADQYRTAGVRRGEVVALHGENSAELAIHIFGTLLSGAVPMLMHPKFSKERADQIRLSCGVERIVREFDLPERWTAPFTLPEKSDQDPAVVLCTSGTTGVSKGVVLSHKNLLCNVEMVLGYLNLNDTDRVLLSGALAHASHFTGVFLAAIASGATLVFYRDMQTPGKWLKAIQEQEITYCYSVPTFARYLARTQQRHPQQVPALRKMQVSGEVVYPTDLLNLQQAFAGVEIFFSYGLTESSPRLTTLLPHEAHRKPVSQGKPLPGVELRVVDEAFADVPAGSVGEIVFKGPNLMLGYLNNPEATAQKMKNGYFRTGDLGYVDEEGYLHIVGRSDEMIIRGGINISPLVVENALLAHPSIREAVVYGEAHPLNGQKICAKLVAEPGQPPLTLQEIQALCKQTLADYEIPEELSWVDELPKTATGKKTRLALHLQTK